MKPVIVWFRQDLRLSDNPALRAAAGAPVIPLYIRQTEQPWAPGGAARWWLHHSLTALDKSLDGHLVLKTGDPAKIIPVLAKQTGAERVLWNRCYEPAAVARDTALKSALAKGGTSVESFNGALLHEPWEITTQAGKPFRVFTPFWKALRQRNVTAPQVTPSHLELHKVRGEKLADWKWLPCKPN